MILESIEAILKYEYPVKVQIKNKNQVQDVPQCKKCRSKYQHQSTKHEIQVQFNFNRTKPNHFRIV